MRAYWRLAKVKKCERDNKKNRWGCRKGSGKILHTLWSCLKMQSFCLQRYEGRKKTRTPWVVTFLCSQNLGDLRDLIN